MSIFRIPTILQCLRLVAGWLYVLTSVVVRLVVDL